MATDADQPDHLGTKLKRVLGGDAAALNTLLAKLRPYLHYLVREQLASAGRYQDYGSDLVQECLYLAWAQFAEFKGKSPDEFRAWLAGILDRRLLRALRFWGEKRRDRRREVPLIATCSAGETLAQTSTSILDRLSQEEECPRPQQCCKIIPDP